MLCRVTVHHNTLFSVRPLNNLRNLAVDSATARTGTKRRSMHILLSVIVSTSCTMRTTRCAMRHRTPTKVIFWRVEVTNLLMLYIIVAHDTLLSSRAASVFGE